jgi:hypothetical protein
MKGLLKKFPSNNKFARVSMKSHVSVLLKCPVNSIADGLNQTLEMHRLDENDIKSIEAHHWDYWRFPTGEHFSDQEVQKAFPSESSDVLRNSTYVRNLPKDYRTSAVITEDGSWSDLGDFGWRLIDEPSPSNEQARQKWLVRLKELLAAHQDHLCVQVVTHC